MFLNGRKVIDASYAWNGRHKDIVDLYLASAFFEDNGQELSDAELEQCAEDNADEMQEWGLEHGGWN